MKVYWELGLNRGTGPWEPSGNRGIADWKLFDTPREAALALKAHGSSGSTYRMVREDGTPLVRVDGDYMGGWTVTPWGGR